MADAFESTLFVRNPYPDAIAEWPGRDREIAYRARDRLLLDHPGRPVVSERSYCMGPEHERWPDPLPENLRINGFTHALVYEVTLG